MSSIDKYVEGEARRCNPNVDVVNRNGRIRGYINGNLVFDIADRYGYLSDSESSIIRQSIRAYEEEERERARREQIRLENERIAARNALKSSIASTKNKLREAFNSAQASGQSLTASFNPSAALASLKNYNVSAFEQKAGELQRKLQSCNQKVESEFNARMQELETLERSVRDDLSTQEYNRQRERLKSVRMTFTSVSYPIDEIEKFKGEIEKIKQSLGDITKIESELGKIQNDGLVGSIATSAIKEIHQISITSVDDVNKLLDRINGHLSQIRDLEYKSQSKDRSDKIALLNGILKSCVQLREYIIDQPYEAADFRSEITQTAYRVLGAYSELDSAAYTTCSRQKINQAYKLVQDVLVGAQSDERTLEQLKTLLDESLVYSRDDRLQEDNYKDYLKKVDELIERGVPIEEIGGFDALDYETQKKALNKMLINLDVREAASRTRTSFVMACNVMENMGYKMLYYNIGGESDQDALACEAVYVAPGCEGVVWQVVATDCNISRKIIGVKRTSGLSTSDKRVKEVAAIAESHDEVAEFFNGYAAEGGGELAVTKDVYTDAPDCDQAIVENGCFELSEEGEKIFDRLVASGDEAAKKKWSTKLSVKALETTEKRSGTSSEIRERESKMANEKIMQARAKKK